MQLGPVRRWLNRRLARWQTDARARSLPPVGSSQHRRIVGRIATTIAIAGVATFGTIDTAEPDESAARPSLSSTADQAIAEPVALDSSHTERRTPDRPDLLLVAAVITGIAWGAPRVWYVDHRRAAANQRLSTPLLTRYRAPPQFA